jgi:hypothetical protein
MGALMGGFGVDFLLECIFYAHIFGAEKNIILNFSGYFDFRNFYIEEIRRQKRKL